MDRRSFIKSIGAAGLLPALPVTSLAGAATTSAAPTVSAHTYQWAEMIVRAHNKCNLGMLQRLLQLDNATAAVLKNKLLENGIISAQANAYGMHTAIKPLYEGAFMNVSDTTSSTLEKTADFLADDAEESEGVEEFDSEINTLEANDDSDFEADDCDFDESEVTPEEEIKSAPEA